MNAVIETARRALWDEMEAAAKVLQQFPSGPSGLTPEAVKADPKWQAAKRAYDTAFQRLRKFNQTNKPPRRSPAYGAKR